MEQVIPTPHALSPLLLIQEFLRDDPWKLLVACIMLNQTSARQVHRVINEFFDRWPNPDALLGADADEVRSFIRPLGFQNRRYERLRRMSDDFLTWDHRNILDLHGIGKYAADSYKIFCEGILVDDVNDKELRRYVSWVQSLPNRACRTD